MRSEAQTGTPKANEINGLVAVMPSKAGANKNPAQAVLDLGIARQVEIDGIGMGALCFAGFGAALTGVGASPVARRITSKAFCVKSRLTMLALSGALQRAA